MNGWLIVFIVWAFFMFGFVLAAMFSAASTRDEDYDRCRDCWRKGRREEDR